MENSKSVKIPKRNKSHQLSFNSYKDEFINTIQQGTFPKFGFGQVDINNSFAQQESNELNDQGTQLWRTVSNQITNKEIKVKEFKLMIQSFQNHTKQYNKLFKHFTYGRKLKNTSIYKKINNDSLEDFNSEEQKTQQVNKQNIIKNKNLVFQRLKTVKCTSKRSNENIQGSFTLPLVNQFKSNNQSIRLSQSLRHSLTNHRPIQSQSISQKNDFETIKQQNRKKSKKVISRNLVIHKKKKSLNSQFKPNIKIESLELSNDYAYQIVKSQEFEKINSAHEIREKIKKLLNKDAQLEKCSARKILQLGVNDQKQIQMNPQRQKQQIRQLKNKFSRHLKLINDQQIQ